MQRRDLIAGIAALLLAPQRSSAQSPGKISRVGILTAERASGRPNSMRLERGSATLVI